jgi:hypothetical protein
MLSFLCRTRAASLRGRLVAAAIVTLVTSAAFVTTAQAAPIYGATADTAALIPVDTATATTVFPAGVDDATTEITSPFAVQAYGASFTTLTVGSNGYVGLGAGTANTLGADDTTDFGTPVVSGFTSDLYTADTGGVYAETRGTAPDRQLVLEWQVNVCCSGDPVTSRFQIILAESSPVVEVLYDGTLADQGWVGIKRDVTEFTRFGATEQTDYPAAGTRVAFRPLSVSTTPISADDTPTFSGFATDPAENVTVDVYAGTDTTVAPVRTLTATPDAGGNYSVTLADADNLAEGGYTVQATQTATTSAPQAFTIDRTAPVVSLTGPSGRIADNRPAFTGTTGGAAGDDGATVAFYAGPDATGTPVATINAAAGAAYTATPSAALNDGTYTVQAVQTDAAGNRGVSASRTFVVDTTAPAVTLTAPVAGASTTGIPAFAGTGGTAAGDGDVVITIRPGTATTGDAAQTLTTGVAANGTFSASPATALAPGQYTAVASQRDVVGNAAASGAITFTVVARIAATPAPAPTQAQPAAAAPAACQSRRLIRKHLRRPSGSRLRVVATLNGRRIDSTVRRADIVIPVDLRGRREGTYTLRVSITRTLRNRETVRTVTRVAYRTCD